MRNREADEELSCPRKETTSWGSMLYTRAQPVARAASFGMSSLKVEISCKMKPVVPTTDDGATPIIASTNAVALLTSKPPPPAAGEEWVPNDAVRL
jgi:hypothetical protein